MEGYVSVAARRFFTSLCGTERAWTVILFSVDIAPLVWSRSIP